MKLKVTVIGAGIAGLALAIRMAIRGHIVTVYEKSSNPGGRIAEHRWGGYRWDIGPSQFLLPDQLEELFLMAGEEMKMSVRYRQEEIMRKVFFEDGLVLDSYAEIDEFAREVEEKTGEKAERVKDFLKHRQNLFDLSRKLLVQGGIRSLGSFFQFWRLESGTTMHRSNSRRFKSKYLVQLFDYYATLNGSNPYKAVGTVNISAHLQHNLGVYVPEKGMYILVEELYRLALRLGVKFEFDSEVKRILHSYGTVKGIQTDKKQEKSDLVISDIDITYLYSHLLPDFPMAKKFRKGEESSSALVFLWAVDKKFDGLDSFNLFLTEDPQKEFAWLGNNKGLSVDPTIEVSISSRNHSSDAPEGCENWVVMVNTPRNDGQDWEKLTEEVRERVIAKLDRQLHSAIKNNIKYEKVIDPKSMEKRGNVYKGSLYGKVGDGRIPAFGRHPNHLRALHGIYFVGGTVHPGGGIQMSLASAGIVENLIVKHYY